MRVYIYKYYTYARIILKKGFLCCMYVAKLKTKEENHLSNYDA